MNLRRNSNLWWNYFGKFTLFISIIHFLCICANIWIVHIFVKFFHINIIFSFINENISILNLSFELFHCLNHSRIIILSLWNIIKNRIFFSSKSFMRYIWWIEVPNNCIIEFIPFSIRVFSILDKRIIMTLISSTCMNNSSL